ncbi:SH3 domain-containing protein [Streptomyces monashensis]|uniref:SH3 domain-containing protein n=1 Tax=Streptomyces monashensis TaxID=1678012 RepID=UPI0033C766B8
MKIATRIVGAAASTALLIGGAMVAAPTASAAPQSASASALPRACDWEWAWPQKESMTTAVNLRSGPGTTYTSLGMLYKGVRFTEYCNKKFQWSYGKVTSGPNAGRWGWVKSSYLWPA